MGALPRRRASEESPDHVTCVRRRCIRKGIRNGEETIGSFVPRQIVIPSSQNIRGTRVEIIQHLLKRRTDALLRGTNRRRKWLAGEQKQMPAFIGCQPERLRQAFQDLCRGMHITSLLQPNVPGGANIGKLRDLFKAQPWRSNFSLSVRITFFHCSHYRERCVCLYNLVYPCRKAGTWNWQALRTPLKPTR